MSAFTTIDGGIKIASISSAAKVIRASREVAQAADRLLELLDPECTSPRTMYEDMRRVSKELEKTLIAWSELDYELHPQVLRCRRPDSAPPNEPLAA